MKPNRPHPASLSEERSKEAQKAYNQFADRLLETLKPYNPRLGYKIHQTYSRPPQEWAPSPESASYEESTARLST